MYPDLKEEMNELTSRRLDHKAFMEVKAQDVSGRSDILDQVGFFNKVYLMLYAQQILKLSDTTRQDHKSFMDHR